MTSTNQEMQKFLREKFLELNGNSPYQHFAGWQNAQDIDDGTINTKGDLNDQQSIRF